MGLLDKLKKKIVRKEEAKLDTKMDENRGYVGNYLKIDVTDEKLERIEKMLEELLEIKELYKDMLDWMIERAKSRNRESLRQIEISPDTVDLSPRLRQIIEIVKERGEALASDISQITGLSQNRCSELLNVLFKAGYLEKVRKGRKVYYRIHVRV